jgi:cytochrome P450
MAATAAPQLLGEAPPSPAGPVEEAELAGLRTPPMVGLPPALQVLRFNQRQIEFVFGARRRLGDVWRFHGVIEGDPTVTCHPDHVRSIFTAKPDLVPSLTAESPLRPIVGAGSVLTANGPRHLRQRRVLLPPFHGEAIAHYEAMIREAAEREVASWRVGSTIALAPRMQAITLDVIMAGIFGIEGELPRRSPEFGLRVAVREIMRASTQPHYQLIELMNLGNDEPIGATKLAMSILDRFAFAIIRQRRAAAGTADRRDILSLLLQARTEEGDPLTDQELRDELLSLVLAGHETTANSLAWAWERLVRTPGAQERLVERVRGGDGAAEEVEAVICETMRSRPVIPMVGRRPTVPWRLGDFGVPAGAPVSMSILLLHHREDLYPEPFAFRPERWHGAKPGTYEWIPFGGGTRRCLGAALAMAEMRVVLETMAARVDLAAADPAPERAVHRNVTMIPREGARVVVRSRV